jgi:hypothetical protein
MMLWSTLYVKIDILNIQLIEIECLVSLFQINQLNQVKDSQEQVNQCYIMIAIK